MAWPPLSLRAASPAAAAIACGSDIAATADPAASMNARLVSFMQCSSCLDGYPELESAHAGSGIEGVVEAFKTRRVGGLVPRVRQPLSPDRADRAADLRDMCAMREDGIFLRA